MKLLIVSDIHGNWPALAAVLAGEPDFDQILCLGDLVNYGPMPVECVAWAKGSFTDAIILQGNHDRALGLDTSPNCSPAYSAIAEATRAFTERMLAPQLKRFLAKLKPLQRFQLLGRSCVACHACPTEPLYQYLTEAGSVAQWEFEVGAADMPDVLFLGHTHLPMKTRLMNTLIINPGSVGQPKDGDPRAAYAVWEDGEVTLRRAVYDVEETIRAYDGLGLEPQVKDKLSEILRTGGQGVKIKTG